MPLGSCTPRPPEPLHAPVPGALHLSSPLGPYTSPALWAPTPLQTPELLQVPGPLHPLDPTTTPGLWAPAPLQSPVALHPLRAPGPLHSFRLQGPCTLHPWALHPSTHVPCTLQPLGLHPPTPGPCTLQPLGLHHPTPGPLHPSGPSTPPAPELFQPPEPLQPPALLQPPGPLQTVTFFPALVAERGAGSARDAEPGAGGAAGSPARRALLLPPPLRLKPHGAQSGGAAPIDLCRNTALVNPFTCARKQHP